MFRSPARVSVLVPVCNGADFLVDAFESLRAQTVPVAEVIAVDDGSTDDSVAVIRRFPFVTLIQKKHSGISRTLNRALEAATGDFIAFLDQDDRWLPEKNALQLAALKANPSLDFVMGHVRRFRSEPGRPDLPIDVLRGVNKLCMMIRSSAFHRVGNFTTEKRHDFLDWYCRAQEAGLRGSMLPDIVAERRVHASNFGVKNLQLQRETYLGALKASLDRRRLAHSLPAQNRP